MWCSLYIILSGGLSIRYCFVYTILLALQVIFSASNMASRFGSERVAQIMKTGMWCSLYIILSGGLINFNKFLIHASRFPHPMALTALHMAMSFILASVVLLVKPDWMP